MTETTGELLPERPEAGGGVLAGLITVLLAEDQDLLRSALISLLGAEADLRVAAAVPCQERAVLRAVQRFRPNVAVVHVNGASALALISTLCVRIPDCQIVARVPTRPPGLIRQLIAAGVHGAVDINAPAARLLEAIRGVSRGEVVVDTQLAVAALTVPPNPFTARELEVLRLAAAGEAGPAIAKRLYLSAGTVRNYLSRAITKTNARTRFDAIRIAHDYGWL
jgi:two-component system, NarL family, response regulator DesR